MQSIYLFVRKNLLVVALGVVVLFLLIKPSYMASQGFTSSSMSYDMGAPAMMESAGSQPFMGKMGVMTDRSPIMPSPVGDSVNPNQESRKVVKNASVSLLVKDVRASINQITQQVSSAGGFLVNSNLNSPEEGASANLSVRVPSDQLENLMNQLRGMSVKVVSENISGYDVTDQYTDSEARLKTLNDTKGKFEAMLSEANTVDEILRVQQSIIQVQEQIDAVKGQLQYLENTSKTSLITIYLSTDELALPYAPTDAWRPQVVFKTAVRSLVSSLRGFANAAIWLAVYSPILLGTIVFIFVVSRYINKSQKRS